MQQPSQHRRLQDVLKKSRRLSNKQNVVTTSGKRRPIYDVLKTSDLDVLKTSNLGRLENVWFTTFSGRLIYDALKTSNLRCLEDVQFTTSWRRLIYDVLKTSVKWHLCSNVVATSMQLTLYCLKYSKNFKYSSWS